MSGMVSNLFKFASRTIHQQLTNVRQFHALPSTIPTTGSIAPCNLWSMNSIRTIVRNNFPKPRENIRVKKLGWRARLSTKAGRRVLMRRILKGRWYWSH